MIREDLEFRIARYADGELTDAERASIEAELAADPEARAVLAEYQTLRSAIEEAAGPALPRVHWDRLEQLLSAAVAASSAGEAPRPGEATRPLTGTDALGIEQEFAIACHADGSLSPQGRTDVEQLISTDPRAKALLDEYHDVDAVTRALAYSDVMPAVQWDGLTSRISRTVDAAARSSVPEDIERQIAALAEGTLPAHELPAIEQRLATDPLARILASDYRNLDSILRVASGAPMPAVDWDRLAQRISAEIDRQSVQAAVRLRQSPPESYSILKWLAAPGRLALAASLLIGVTVAGRLLIHGGGTTTGPGPGPVFATKPIEQIAVLEPEKPTGTSQMDISFGPPDGIAESAGGDDIISHPPRAFVASGRASPNDAEADAQALPAMPF